MSGIQERLNKRRYRYFPCFHCGERHRAYCKPPRWRKNEIREQREAYRRRSQKLALARLHAPLIPGGPRLCPDIPCPYCALLPPGER